MRKKLAVLGAGNMGLSIAEGIVCANVLNPSDIILVRRSIDKLSPYELRGFRTDSDLLSAAREADVVMLCVKPQMLPEVLTAVAPALEEKLVVSIAAGVKIDTIRKSLPASRVVRAMPNTPLTVGEGVTELCRAQDVSDEDFAFAKSLFDGAGLTIECKEEEINAMTALTSSAVAYFAAVEKAMCDWAQKNGLESYDRALLCDLVSKTAMGSAKLMLEKNVSPEALIKSVASPNGTTERALRVFSEQDLDGVFDEAMTACLKRAEELSRSE